MSNRKIAFNLFLILVCVVIVSFKIKQFNAFSQNKYEPGVKSGNINTYYVPSASLDVGINKRLKPNSKTTITRDGNEVIILEETGI